ncbi:transcriptional regulator, LexA family [Planococcus sp. PAMC 21323]|uniref:transcriptional repressor LexA n=1 Tax=Planococcus sp. PAMC 21323 TaxID=1526927 RepID=UPI000571ABBC|nr:transcriptional repressor LexA [Planococcus sp. PAMC 21323]AIY06259.1 transcriptional regulator, LexA family [Planococcus sp. PAMC 21323]
MKLNIEQRRIVELEPSGPMLVKGVAGSGKTTVAIRRIHFLLDHYCHEENDKVLLVTYNKTLLHYIKHQYERMAEKELQEAERFFSSDAEVEITTIDSMMFKEFRRYQKRIGKRLEISPADKTYKVMIQAIHEVKKSYPDVKLLLPKNSKFLLDEVEWIYSCAMTDLETYQSVDRIGRASGNSGTPQKLLKNSQTREAIYAVMTLFRKLLEKAGLTTFKLMNLYALEELRLSDAGRYTHILIDESQDLTRVQLEFLKELYKEKEYSSLMFVADNTQSIYPQSWLGKGRPFTTIGYDMSGKSRTLSKNYRTTTEISTAAFQLIEADDSIQSNVDFVKPALIDRHGHPPIYRFFLTPQQQIKFLAEEISMLKNDYRLSEMCIVARGNRNIESAAADLEKAGIACEILQSNDPDFESDKVKLVTMHSIKGLEFKVIFLIDLNSGLIPQELYADAEDQKTVESDERKLLYVGMTRANELLYMSSVKKPSSFVKEINRNYLRMKKEASLRPFESISMTEYRLADRLVDVHAKEEVTRQWLIRELHETYGYPYELMELEFPVQQFSKKGYCDIAVQVYTGEEARPYIIAEVKRFGSGIEDAMIQLKSYMEADSRIFYGIATDGLEVKIIDRKGEEVQDLPKCRAQFLPNTKNRRLYKNLKSGRQYDYAEDQDTIGQIEVREAGQEVLIQVHETVAVPLIGNVAAGIPVLATESYETFHTLPREWVVSPSETFSLTVTGDSMIGAGINKGDVVIVHQQNNASNGDIVIAVIDGEATMKKYMPMGSDIILMSENPSYEPIVMRSEDVFINGRVIGVLKQ